MVVRALAPAFLGVLACAGVAAGQAPELGGLWRVATTTLSGPPALERGPTGTFWNPAAAADRHGLAAAVEVLQTPDVVSLSGILVGVSQRLASRVAVGAVAGRVSVEDLVRTTTSPTSEAGEIPAYEQLVGAAVAGLLGPLALGAILRVHDSQFAALAGSGVTVDLGFRVTPWSRLTVAGASRFAPPGFGSDPAADYAAGAEYGVTTASVWGAPAVVTGRYGVTYRDGVGVDHLIGAGVALERRLRVDLGVTREGGYGSGAWRSALSVAFQVGRYVIAIARGSGLNGVGASFRLSLTAAILE